MQLVAKAFHESADVLKLRKLAEPDIPGAIKKLVQVLPFAILMGIVQVNCHCTKQVPTYFIFLKYILKGIQKLKFYTSRSFILM